MNKKGAASLVIAGIPIGAIIIFLFQMWAANQVFDALEPELQKAMIELGDAVVCPPELKNSEFDVCIDKDGEVIVNGNVDEIVNLELQTEGNSYLCTINIGEHLDKKTCRFDDFHRLENLNLIYTYKATTMKVNSKNLEFYIFNNKNLKIPIKKWKGFWKVTKYIPK